MIFPFKYHKKTRNWPLISYLKLALPLLFSPRVVSHDSLPNLKGGASVNQSNQKDPKKGMPTGKPTAAPGPSRPQPNPAKKPMGK